MSSPTSSLSASGGPSFTAWTHSTPPFGSSLKRISYTPPPLTPTQLLVEVHRAAINPVDVQLCNLSIFRLAALSYPKGIAADYSGTVVAVGNEVSEFKVGDEVMGFHFAALGKPWEGSLSQVRIVASSSAIVKKPASLSSTEAASLPLVFQTAMTALTPPYTPIIPSPSIVVLGGSSGVGIYTIQYAKLELGAQRIIATCSGKNADFVKSIGAIEVVDYTSEDVLARLMSLRPEGGYTTIVDCVGGTELIPHLGQLLAPRSKAFKDGGGYITIVGDKTDSSSIGGAMIYWTHPKMMTRALWGWYGWGPRYSCISLRSGKEMLQKAVTMAQEKGMKIVIDGEYAFAEVEKAYERLMSRRARGKIVVRVKEDQ